jgi:lipopolysaccharide export system protein LptA
MPALCEDMPVRVKANDLNFDQEAGLITASGSVEIRFEGITIESDSARIDTNANVATAEGHVKIKRSDYDILSSGLTYDISGETAVVLNLKTVFYPEGINANFYVSAEKLTDLPDKKMGENGSLTTCDYAKPHYHVNCRWFDYYPDDKLVGYWAMLYVGDTPTPVLTPYFVYDIKKKRSPYSFVYGQNDVEGKFLKTSFDYFINNSANGVFYLDTTERKGPGYGFSHDYVLNPQNSGNLYYYGMNEQDTKLNDYVVKLKHNIDIDKYSKLTLTHDSEFMYQVPAGRKNGTSSSVGYTMGNGVQTLAANYSASEDKFTFQNSQAFNINNRIGSYNTGFSWDESNSEIGPKWKNSHDKFFHEQSLFTDDAKLSLNVNYSSYATDEGATADELLKPTINFTYKGPFYALKVTEDWYADPDGNKFTGDNTFSYLEKLPEISLGFNTIDLKYFNLNLGLGAARFHEAQFISGFSRMRNMTANRYSLSAALSRTDNLGFGTYLKSGVGVNQYDYDTGDQRYQLTESLNMGTDLGGFFRNSAGWGMAKVKGNSPFVFETLGSESEYVNDKITLYYQNKVTFDISGGYNYLNSTYDDVISNLSVVPNEKLSFNMSGGWSIQNQMYRDLSAGMTVSPWPKFVNTANIVYNLNSGAVNSANTLVDLEVGDTWQNRWHFKMGHVYDPSTDTLILTDLAIVKDLHCWEAVFTYNDFLKEYKFGLTLKAFPQFPLSYVSSPNGSYFNSFMDNMHFEQESPRRD